VVVRQHPLGFGGRLSEQDGQGRVPGVGRPGRLGEQVPLVDEDARAGISAESRLALQVRSWHRQGHQNQLEHFMFRKVDAPLESSSTGLVQLAVMKDV
jgi:hypothetical protein